MVGGLAGGKTKAKGQPPGNIQRPTSFSDFNEAEEESWSIDRMSDKDIMDVRSIFYFYNLKNVLDTSYSELRCVLAAQNSKLFL